MEFSKSHYPKTNRRQRNPSPQLCDHAFTIRCYYVPYTPASWRISFICSPTPCHLTNRPPANFARAKKSLTLTASLWICVGFPWNDPGSSKLKSIGVLRIDPPRSHQIEVPRAGKPLINSTKMFPNTEFSTIKFAGAIWFRDFFLEPKYPNRSSLGFLLPSGNLK